MKGPCPFHSSFPSWCPIYLSFLQKPWQSLTFVGDCGISWASGNRFRAHAGENQPLPPLHKSGVPPALLPPRQHDETSDGLRPQPVNAGKTCAGRGPRHEGEPNIVQKAPLPPQPRPAQGLPTHLQKVQPGTAHRPHAARGAEFVARCLLVRAHPAYRAANVTGQAARFP